MRRVGWFGESQRHALAARGVRTRRQYMAFKDVLKSGLASGMESSMRDKGENERRMFRLRWKDRVRNELVERALEDVEADRLKESDVEAFLSEEFAPAAEEFEENGDVGRFRDEVDRSYARFRRVHAKVLHIWTSDPGEVKR